MDVFPLIHLVIALTSTVCARQTRPDRSYHPMLKVIWAVFGFIYFGSFLNGVLGNATGDGTPFVTRLAFNLVALTAVLYSAWFMRKRNKTPRFLGLNLNGDIVMTPIDDLEGATRLAESWARHGAMPAETVARLEASLREWHRMEEWRKGVLAEAKANRFKRRG